MAAILPPLLASQPQRRFVGRLQLESSREMCLGFRRPLQRQQHAGGAEVAEGFFWVDCSDHENSVLSFVRQTRDHRARLLVVMNMTPLLRQGYQLGVPEPGKWLEVLNSDAGLYGGSNQGNLGGVDAVPNPAHGHGQSLSLTLPPLGIVAMRPARCEAAAGRKALPAS